MEKLQLLPEQAGYSYKRGSELLSVQLDGGRSKIRKDLEGVPSIVECRWFLSDCDYQYFTAFLNNRINKGLDFFLIDLILDQPFTEEFVARFVPDSIEMGNVRGLSVVVGAELEVEPTNDLLFDDAILALYGEKDLLNLLEQLVNYDLRVSS